MAPDPRLASSSTFPSSPSSSAPSSSALRPPPSPPAQIPLNTAIRESGDGGVPIVYSQPDSPEARTYVSVAERVWQKLQEQDQEAQHAGRPPPIVSL